MDTCVDKKGGVMWGELACGVARGLYSYMPESEQKRAASAGWGDEISSLVVLACSATLSFEECIK